jgi:predicted nucleic acid-binding protein
MSLQIPKKKPELKIVFDTNVIFNGSSSELLKEEVELIIKENSEHNDLDIHWYLPQVVIFERQYQMIRKGVELLSSIEKLERLLGHKLAIGEDVIETKVKETINSQISKLSLETIVLDGSR